MSVTSCWDEGEVETHNIAITTSESATLELETPQITDAALTFREHARGEELSCELEPAYCSTCEWEGCTRPFFSAYERLPFLELAATATASSSLDAQIATRVYRRVGEDLELASVGWGRGAYVQLPAAEDEYCVVLEIESLTDASRVESAEWCTPHTPALSEELAVEPDWERVLEGCAELPDGWTRSGPIEAGPGEAAPAPDDDAAGCSHTGGVRSSPSGGWSHGVAVALLWSLVLLRRRRTGG